MLVGRLVRTTFYFSLRPISTAVVYGDTSTLHVPEEVEEVGISSIEW